MVKLFCLAVFAVKTIDTIQSLCQTRINYRYVQVWFDKFQTLFSVHIIETFTDFNGVRELVRFVSVWIKPMRFLSICAFL